MLDLLCACVAFELDLLHALEHRAVHVDGAHVMVESHLAAGAHLAQRATGELKILAGVLVLVTRDEEQFLLEADVAHSTLDVKFHEAKELLALIRHCGGGTRKRGLLEDPGGRSWLQKGLG
jgi:hypothetical protein